MKSVLISIKPKWCELIASGKKTIEVRKTRPKCDVPFKCYIYATKLDIHSSPLLMLDRKTIQTHLDINDEWSYCENINGRVIGEFVCDRIQETFEPAGGFVDVVDCDQSCLSAKEIIEYANGNVIYFWHITNLVIYDKPKELSKFNCRKLVWRGNNHIHSYEEITRPPQSWQYVEVSL